MDAFSAQIVRFVREMPDEALLELVTEKLGIIRAAVSRSHDSRSTSPARAASAATPKAKNKNNKRDAGSRSSQARTTRPPAISADRQAVLDTVENIVKANGGVSASDVAREASIPQTRAAAALKELKLAKRIFQGGDRRFARYAADAKTAEQASAVARKNAKGPVVRGPRSSARPRKRPSVAVAANVA